MTQDDCASGFEDHSRNITPIVTKAQLRKDSCLKDGKGERQPDKDQRFSIPQTQIILNNEVIKVRVPKI